jgi:ABC-type multidrug transport system ATPase subunit
VLDDVTGSAVPGELVAMLGSTGAGKSTLLDILAGTHKGGTITGRVLVNGWAPRSKRHLVGYVSQDDCLLATQTVWETLMFYAVLRLPSAMSHAQKRAAVDALIAELGLEKARNTYVGNALIRGISGGERKRLAIGCQVISRPGLLLADEPNTGLDCFNSLAVMLVLKNLARQGHTVLCTLHQPRASIVNLLDRVLILSNGKLVYSGQTASTTEHFQRLGWQHPEHTNPADFALDVAILSEEGPSSLVRDRYLEHSDDTVIRRPDDETDIATGDRATVSLTEYYNDTIKPDVVARTKELEDAAIAERRRKKQQKEKEPPEYSAPWLLQTAILVKRNTQGLIRDPRVFLSQLFTTVLLAVVISTMFISIGFDQRAI